MDRIRHLFPIWLHESKDLQTLIRTQRAIIYRFRLKSSLASSTSIPTTSSSVRPGLTRIGSCSGDEHILAPLPSRWRHRLAAMAYTAHRQSCLGAGSKQCVFHLWIEAASIITLPAGVLCSGSSSSTFPRQLLLGRRVSWFRERSATCPRVVNKR